VRPAALFLLIASSAFLTALAETAAADCSAPGSPCVDAEPMWLSPSGKRLLLVSDAAAPGAGQAELGLGFGFRYRPAVLTVPAPNENGRDVNLIRLSTDVSVAARLGLGNRLELTLFAPAGLDQQGAGFKGVTTQSAPSIPVASLHDPRLGFGYSLPLRSASFGAKLRFEAKLPLGSAEALAGERSFVASPSFALTSKLGGFFWGAELGARLRRPTEFFGLRVGSQALLAVGGGYELERPRLTFAAEMYLLPSLIASGGVRYLPAEWLTSVRFAPSSLPALSFGVGGGSGLPLSSSTGDASFAFGVPSFRALGFVRLSPSVD
jgi:hypothetical protein